MTPEERKALEGFVAALRQRYKSSLVDVLHIRTWPRKDDPPFHSAEVDVVLENPRAQIGHEETLVADLTYDALMNAGICIQFNLRTRAEWEAVKTSPRRRASSLLIAA
jgi:hypothetical protein